MTAEQYNECVDRHSDNVYRFILKNLHDEDKAKDVIQDAFEKLWVKLDTVSADKAKSYLFTTAYHLMIDLLRREKKSATMDEVDFSEQIHNSQFSDLNDILNEAVSRLPEKQRSVVLLRDYEGYSYEEIGQITGLSEAQVKVYIFRARAFLKNYIGSLERVI
jgi:RNA polymerase sigma-70 factor (ECF subfamily)